MPRHSGAQPGAMVTDRDHWSVGTVIGIIAIAAIALLAAYSLMT
jgi:hypothetical protein